MNTEVETMKKKIVIAIVSFLVTTYLVIRRRKSNLYYDYEKYDSYGNPIRNNSNFLLLVVCLFQLGMQLKNEKGVSARVSSMVQYVAKKNHVIK
ncbi:hypothetical protein [Bacillus multifaciens]|uniref:hypothetical protein n=1 Tax=Bacillus multifaciens TaxID=3068506 RepID=UPI002741D6CB|nr:hypothetical protein [Bacillus sp. WLY-B-L8]MDP7981484.1 hypothetical protein [Bacillus sp. WLY-B-L8]